jgi:osmotically-inducible protein OsmY
MGNPLYSGRPGSTNLSPAGGGGFGQPSFGTTTTTTGAGARGGAGGVGAGGRGGTASVGMSGQGNQSISQISHVAELKFPVAAIVSSQLQTELQGVISRSSMLSAPAGIKIEVAGSTVVIRGQAADDDEIRLVEGMIRLTPGVHEVRNELKRK